MQPELNKYLIDILTAIRWISRHIEAVPTGAAFAQDVKTQHAVLNQLAVIGEAMNRVLKRNPSLALTDARRVVDFRNLIIHSYDTIVTEVVWDIIKNKLPILKAEVQSLLPPDSFAR